MSTIPHDPPGSADTGPQAESPENSSEKSPENATVGVEALAEALARRNAELERALIAERRARAAAEADSRARDEFFSVVSHELRSPLNAILGWNRILSLKCGGDAEVASIAPRIEQSARTQLKIVNDMLDFGRIGAGRLRISPRRSKFATLAGVAVDAARAQAEAKGVQLVLQPGPPGNVVGDPDRLLQVIANLLSNAVKYTSSGGQVEVSLREADDHVELSVRDTGKGIAPERQEHLFDRQARAQGRASGAAHESSTGLGIGLTLVREIVTLHRGRVWAHSEGEGHGARFCVSLPAAGAEAGDDEARSAPAQPQSLVGLRILVVDDEPDARTVVAEALRHEGAEVSVADSAAAAFEQLHDPVARCDVLVTDICMPDEDGYSLVRRLRLLPSAEKVAVIALSGRTAQRDVDAAIEAGFDLHVAKPVDFDSFVPSIRRAAGLRRRL